MIAGVIAVERGKREAGQGREACILICIQLVRAGAISHCTARGTSSSDVIAAEPVAVPQHGTYRRVMGAQTVGVNIEDSGW
eukprot:SAG25_NODE_6045_length_594_cov_0.505051_1_plen_81_part_00